MLSTHGGEVYRGGEVAARGAIRRTNVSAVLRLLRKHGPQSRTEIAATFGLPNSTVSKLVAELLDLGLVTGGEARRAGSIGRPQQAVTLRSGALCGLGVEISVNYVRAIALDLPGDVLLDRRVPVEHDRTDHRATLRLAAELIAAAVAQLHGSGSTVAGVTVAVPGQVDPGTGVVTLAANLGWTRLPIAAELSAELTDRLGPGTPPVRVDNDARLGAVAEHCLAPVPDLLYVTGEVGVAGGLIINDTLVRGAGGFAGEIGHMPLDPDPRPCACGRRGCWETMVGLPAFLRYAAEESDPVRDPHGDLEERLTVLGSRGDRRTVAAIGRLAADLGTGIGLLVNVLDPRLVILGGYFSYLGDALLERVRAEVTDRVLAPQAGGCELRLSGLGFTSAARGAAETVLERVFQDPAEAPTPAR
ncbi:MAG: ROK family transcriptional regulator [Actinocatenispora sp.]